MSKQGRLSLVHTSYSVLEGVRNDAKRLTSVQWFIAIVNLLILLQNQSGIKTEYQSSAVFMLLKTIRVNVDKIEIEKKLKTYDNDQEALLLAEWWDRTGLHYKVSLIPRSCL